jgi:hypothetical protein
MSASPNPGRVNHPQIQNRLNEVEGFPEFTIESILSHDLRTKRKGQQVIYYLVKWEGFGSEHNSWEPEDNLTSYGKYENTAITTHWNRVSRPEVPAVNGSTPSHRETEFTPKQRPGHSQNGLVLANFRPRVDTHLGGEACNELVTFATPLPHFRAPLDSWVSAPTTPTG